MVDIYTTAFIEGGVYVLKRIPGKTTIFVCQGLSGGIGKLIQYYKDIHIEKNIWRKTGVQYFLNSYEVGSIKELFIKRDNYDMIGTLGNNYRLDGDEKGDYITAC